MGLFPKESIRRPASSISPQVWTWELSEQRLWLKWLIFALIRVRLHSLTLCCAFFSPSHPPHTPLGPLRRIWGLTERDQTVVRPEPFNSSAQLRLGERRLGGYNKRVWESLQGRAQRKRGTESKKHASCCFYIIHHFLERTCWGFCGTTSLAACWQPQPMTLSISVTNVEVRAFWCNEKIYFFWGYRNTLGLVSLKVLSRIIRGSLSLWGTGLKLKAYRPPALFHLAQLTNNRSIVPIADPEHCNCLHSVCTTVKCMWSHQTGLKCWCNSGKYSRSCPKDATNIRGWDSRAQS